MGERYLFTIVRGGRRKGDRPITLRLLHYIMTLGVMGNEGKKEAVVKKKKGRERKGDRKEGRRSVQGRN